MLILKILEVFECDSGDIDLRWWSSTKDKVPPPMERSKREKSENEWGNYVLIFNVWLIIRKKLERLVVKIVKKIWLFL